MEQPYLNDGFIVAHMEDYKPPIWDPLTFIGEDMDFGVNVDIPLVQELDQRHREFSLPKPRINDIISGFEVGDDRIDFCGNGRKLQLALVVQELFLKMKTSKYDTFISDEFWNFCETTGFIPSNPSNNFDYCRKSGNFKMLDFPDFPPLRIICDTKKGDLGHSSTEVGKVSMLGSRLKSLNPMTKATMLTASWFQDAMLNTMRMKEPKYMPKHIGGSGCVAPFGVPSNVLHYMKTYKGGTYSRVYGSAINELREVIRSYEETGSPAAALLCNRLRQKQEYLHGTYGEWVSIPKAHLHGDRFSDNLPMPLYEEHGGFNLFCSFEQRLLAAKEIISRRGAEIEIEKDIKIRQHLFGIAPIQVTEQEKKLASYLARERFEFALSANAAFQRLLARCANHHDFDALKEHDFFKVPYGVKDLDHDLVQWLFNDVTGEILTIDDTYLPEKYYLREEVIGDHCLKIEGIPLAPELSNKIAYFQTTTRVGLWQISGDMKEWATKVANSLKQRRDTLGRPLSFHDLAEIYNSDREWVSDDTGLVAYALDKVQRKGSLTFIIVSLDRRLCGQLAKTCNCYVMRIRPQDVYSVFPETISSSNPSLSSDEVEEKFPDGVYIPTRGGIDPEVLFDLGSMQAIAAKMSQEPETGDIQWSTPVDFPERRSMMTSVRKSVRKVKYLSPKQYLSTAEWFSPLGGSRVLTSEKSTLWNRRSTGTQVLMDL